MRDNKHLKNNIYQKIFNHIISTRQNESSSKIKTRNAKYLLTSGNERIQNINVLSVKRGHEINDTIKSISKKLETEGNEDRKSFYMELWRNKFISNQLQKKVKNKNNEDFKLSYFGGNNNITLNPKMYNYDSNNINMIEKRNMNSINVEAHKHNIYNTLGKRKDQKIILRHNNKFFNNKNVKLFLKNKNKLKETFKSGRQGQDQLDFFQKFLINRNKAESLDKSPKKIIGINCNLVLTKNKEKKEKEEDLEKNCEQIIKKDSQSYDNKNLKINEHILLSNKKNKYDSIKKEPINLLNSPAQSININNQNNNNTKPNKFFNLIYNSSNKDKTKSENHKERINIGCRSCSIKRNHPRRKNLKIDINNRLNNLRIINLNTENNTVQKESNHKEQEMLLNNNILNINTVLKTEGNKNIHFLDKVIQKLNAGKDKKNKMHIFLGPKNNEENKQVFRFLSLEKNNNEFLVNPFFVKYYKNNQIDDEKKQPIPLKGENNFLEKLNHRIELNINSGSSKFKKLFPNLIPFNKK